MLKRYTVRIKDDGWAIIVIDTSIGFFSTVSSWGNYAYLWSSTGCEFRKFLTEVHDDYVTGKLLSGRPMGGRVRDGRATRKNVFEHIRSMARESYWVRGRAWARYEHERDVYRKHVRHYDFDNDYEFGQWWEATRIDDAAELGVFEYDSQCVRFCKVVLPLFQAMLREELALESALTLPAGAT